MLLSIPHHEGIPRTDSAYGTVYRLERERGFEPPTSSLARKCSTTELLPLACPPGRLLHPCGGPEPQIGYWSAEGQNRTGDTSIFSAVLYQLSYLGSESNVTAGAARQSSVTSASDKSLFSHQGRGGTSSPLLARASQAMPCSFAISRRCSRWRMRPGLAVRIIASPYTASSDLPSSILTT